MVESYRAAPRILLVAFLAGLVPAATAAAAPAATTVTPAATSKPAAATDPLPRRAFLGTPVGPVSAATRAHQKLADSTGVEIRGVLPGSSAEAAKLRPGDVVVQVDGWSGPSFDCTLKELETTAARYAAGLRMLSAGRDRSLSRLPPSKSRDLVAGPNAEQPADRSK